MNTSHPDTADTDIAASSPPRADREQPVASRTDDVLSIVFGTALSLLAIGYTISSYVPLLIAWELTAIGYLVVVFTKFRNRSITQGGHAPRALPRKVLEYLSWAFPLVASVTGVAAAVSVLTTQHRAEAGGTSVVVVGVLGAVGVIIAWGLLQTGFAEVYEGCYEYAPEGGNIDFPGVAKDPVLGDLLYMSFTIGTSFGSEGATVTSRKIRLIVLVHSVTSFFYNAFLIAIAIQVLQSVIAAG